jgi:hypothetical protein
MLNGNINQNMNNMRTFSINKHVPSQLRTFSDINLNNVHYI